jgi:predicted outer membrane repeat protein
MTARKTRRTRLSMHRLENRDVPAVFNIANGDTASFIAAINTCNFNNEPDTINLAVSGNYTFTSAADAADGGSALPTILRDVADANTVTINGRGSTVQRSAVGGTPNFRLLRISTFPNIVGVFLNDLVITNGNAGANNGGAVELGAGDLTVTNCSFSQNQAAVGGAIYATNTSITPRTLSINGTFTGNQSTNGAGGAVYMLGATNVSILGGTYTNNTSSAEGGALRVQTSSGLTTITGSLFANNTANGGNGGGAIFVQGNTNVTDTTIRDNTCAATAGGGGGIFVQGGSTGTLSMTGCTVSGNRVNNSTASGGGVYNQGNLVVVNSTIHDNRAGLGGGLAFVNGSPTGSITHSTITNNSAFFGIASGGGVTITGTGTLSIGNTIIAGNTLENGGSGPDVGGTINSTGYNLIESTAGATINGTTTGNIYNTSPNLGALQFNGGLTATRLPNAGSPVINAGDPAFSGPPANDQRGAGYPRVVGGRLDIGAVEKDAAAAPRVTGSQVNDGTAQRSRVTSLAVTFSAQVTFATTPTAAFTLTRVSDGASVSFTATAQVVGGVTVVTLNNFTGTATQFGSLADGRYTLTALANQITAGGVQLDGNGDGTPGDNYVFGDQQGLFRFFGDINGDRHVDIADFGLFSATFNLSTGQTGFNAAFDFNNDGHIDIADFGQFSIRLFTVLP